MSIEEVLQQPLDVLEKYTIDDLTKHLGHYFIITRPEEAKKAPVRSLNTGANTIRNAKINRARELAKMAGIDLGL